MSHRDHVLRPMVLWGGLQHLGGGTWREEVRPQKELLLRDTGIRFPSLSLLPGHHEMSSHPWLHTQPQSSASLKTQSNKTTWPWTETIHPLLSLILGILKEQNAPQDGKSPVNFGSGLSMAVWREDGWKRHGNSKSANICAQLGAWKDFLTWVSAILWCRCKVTSHLTRKRWMCHVAKAHTTSM